MTGVVGAKNESDLRRQLALIKAENDALRARVSQASAAAEFCQ